MFPLLSKQPENILSEWLKSSHDSGYSNAIFVIPTQEQDPIKEREKPLEKQVYRDDVVKNLAKCEKKRMWVGADINAMQFRSIANEKLQQAPPDLVPLHSCGNKSKLTFWRELILLHSYRNWLDILVTN